MTDKVLVIGSGGREHAIAEKIAQSPHVGKVYVAPGNGAISEKLNGKFDAVPIKDSDYDAIARYATETKPGMIFIGPEGPLIDGLATRLRENSLRVIGPGRDGAMLEGDKRCARGMMYRYGVPSPLYGTFESYEHAAAYVMTNRRPFFVKASGPVLGKGAIDGETEEMALDALRRIFRDKEFGEAGNGVVIEDKLYGEEASALLMVNSKAGTAIPFPYAQDHKRQLDGDRGPNTGGMGAYAPTTLITPTLRTKIGRSIFDKSMEIFAYQHIDYCGFLYPGIIILSDGDPKVLEYNVRMGDPETQPLLTLLESDFYEMCQDLIDGSLKAEDVKFRPGYAVCVVAASGGYPGKYEKGKLITGLDKTTDDVSIFHAGTRFEDGKFYTNGGRVLGVTGYGATIEEARNRAYDALSNIVFDGMFFRRDIAQREVERCRQ